MSAKSVKKSSWLEDLVRERPSPAVHQGQISGSSVNWVTVGSIERARGVDLFSNFGNVPGYLERAHIYVSEVIPGPREAMTVGGRGGHKFAATGCLPP